MLNVVREIYEYREMMFSLVRKELKGKYKGSFLGFLWSLLIPLFQLVIYTIVFSVFMRSGIEQFYVFLFVALVPWIFFNNSITGGAMSIIQQKNLVQKIYFPRIILPIAFVLSYFINMLLSFIIVFIAVIISGIGIELTLLPYLPIIMLLQFVMGIGVSLLFSAITVFIRDFEYILGVLTMAWMYMTPILYPIDMVPDNIQPLLYWNPMTAVVIAYRDILYYRQVPELQTLGFAVIWSGIMLVIGYVTFQKLQYRFVEEL